MPGWITFLGVPNDVGWIWMFSDKYRIILDNYLKNFLDSFSIHRYILCFRVYSIRFLLNCKGNRNEGKM